MRCRHGCFSSFARSGGIEVRCGSPGQGYGKGFYGSYAWPATCFDSTAQDASEWGMGQASLGCNVIPLRREVIRLLLLVPLLHVATTLPQSLRAESSGPVPSASSMPVSADKVQPSPAWTKFCERLPQECSIDLTEPETLSLTPETWGVIVEVNERVNAMIRAVTDWDHWGVEDRWDYPDDGAGDCEDIQLQKRRLLTAFGFPTLRRSSWASYLQRSAPGRRRRQSR